MAADLGRRAWRRVANHRREAITVAAFMVVVGVVADVTGVSSLTVRILGTAGIAGGLLTAFATVWLPIAVIDFRRCTRETALRHRVEADLERHAADVRTHEQEVRRLTSRTEAVLASGGPEVVYQPIVEVNRRVVAGYEALSRFADGTPPDRWFADAARVGLGLDLELAAVANALGGLAALPPGSYLSVNASPETLRDHRLVELIAASEPERVVVELTEHVPLADYAPFRHVAAVLREMGSRLAIDDAGAGYSSLRHIVDLHPDCIKIDRSIVRGVHLEPARRSLLVALVSFAQDLGATLVAEGVEEAGEEEVLRQWGLRFAQGWYYGHPQSLAAIARECARIS